MALTMLMGIEIFGCKVLDGAKEPFEERWNTQNKVQYQPRIQMQNDLQPRSWLFCSDYQWIKFSKLKLIY